MNPRSIAEVFHGLPFRLDRTRGLAEVLALIAFAADSTKHRPAAKLVAAKAAAPSLESDADEDDEEEVEEERSIWAIENFFPMREPMKIGADGVARISVRGMLSNSLPGIYEALGLATRYTTISADITAAQVAGARAILFAIESGGGSCVGGKEVVQQIRALEIPKASHTAGCEASAAFHIGASTGQVFASESSMAGSVGSILVSYDWSKFYQDYGVAPVVFASGDLKGTGVEGTSLTKEQADYLQGLVDVSAAEFKSDVLQDRGAVAEDSMRGQMFFAGEAQERNLIDAIASEAEVRDWLVAQAAGVTTS